MTIRVALILSLVLVPPLARATPAAGIPHIDAQTSLLVVSPHPASVPSFVRTNELYSSIPVPQPP